MNRIARTTTGVLAAVAGSAALAFAAAPVATAAPQTSGVSICPGLPGQSATTDNCTVVSRPTGLTLAITVDGGVAHVTGDNFSGPAAIAVGDGATVHMEGVAPGLAIGIAGPGAEVTVTGKTAPTCTDGLGFAGDFQTGKGCINTGTASIPLG